jgi:UDP-N-acetylglucosamine pyrophosphorylase
MKSAEKLESVGFERIAAGEVAVCIMSGGQGTRLGFDHPKGMFTLDLDAKYSLFEYFSRKLLRLMELTKRRFQDSTLPVDSLIKWYIMTSEMNHQEVVSFFKEHQYFGYRPEGIFFFPQGGIPAIDYTGKIIIESEGQLALAPGGNGAIYG